MIEIKANDSGIRPAGKPDQCFYCGNKVGELHGPTCVMVERKVTLEYKILVETYQPYHWSFDDIERHRNVGSWCASNLIAELEAIEEREGCLCEAVECSVVNVVDNTPVIAELVEPKPCLRAYIKEVVTTKADDLCWMDVYTKLGAFVGIAVTQESLGTLPKSVMMTNCDKFTSDMCHYSRDFASELLIHVIAERDSLKEEVNQLRKEIARLPSHEAKIM